MSTLKSTPSAVLAALCLTLASIPISTVSTSIAQEPPAETPHNDIESQFLSSVRQLTFEGTGSGEGYFNADGSKMVFQSKREQGNPFYQIYMMDFDSGDVTRISPGYGKTTCSWIHPDGKRVLFASTQDDPAAKDKQLAEIKLIESGQQRRYSWDYDETFELYSYQLETKKYTKLTKAPGYDAEGSYSPDGKLIAFASNRNAYSKPMTDEQKQRFEKDHALMMDIFIMNADGTNVRQLTDVLGYDGGPFFSPDGKRICWRRFEENGAVAEIMTMNIDGSDQRQLTNMRAMSWAPSYHPSSQYLIFNTNKHGFGNFELYLVDVEGKFQPVRVTETDGFDGLASFSPDGKQITWTSNRNEKKESQIYLANWNHQAALNALSMGKEQVDVSTASQSGKESAVATSVDFDPRDIMRHIDYLCRKELGGRLTGTEGEKKATAYVAAYLDNLGLKPAGDNGTWYQQFEFPAGAELGEKNELVAQIDTDGTTKDVSYELNKDWRPLTFSDAGNIEPGAVVFAGYGISAPASDQQDAYDSYVHLDVTDKWVMMFRYMPDNITPEQRQFLQYHSSLRKKAMVARDKGARGIIIVSGPNSKVKDELVPLENDFTNASSSISAISVRDEVAAAWLRQADKDLRNLQDGLDQGTPMMGFEIKNVTVGAEIDVRQLLGMGRNVIGRLQMSDAPSEQAILVGAHVDHLGYGQGGSLAKNEERSMIHVGADDNASGVAGMLEVAEYLATLKRQGKLDMRRDVIFAAWSGEEVGLHGSKHFCDDLYQRLHSHANTQQTGSSPHEVPPSSPSSSVAGPIFPTIAAALNMDMIGRMDKQVVLQGLGSSDYWKPEIEKRNAVVGLSVKPSDDTQLPTDASSFYRAGVPILSAFTGSHSDYHTPRDTPEKLNYPDAARIARLMGLIARNLATSDTIPKYIQQTEQPKKMARGAMRAYLGSIPDYGADVKGVLLSDATKGAPADKAGVKGGDIIVELAGKKIENIYDYTYAIEALKVGQETTIVVLRGDKRIELKITPGSRE